MEEKLSEKQLLCRIRLLVAFFISALLVSGITAFPLVAELNIIYNIITENPDITKHFGELSSWLLSVHEGIINTDKSYPFIAYGTDWLAYAHIIIAIAFVGVFAKPIRNIWIVYWAMVACILIFPLALICGYIREIPLFWILVDCSFGIFGLIPLYFLTKYIKQLSIQSGWCISSKY